MYNEVKIPILPSKHQFAKLDKPHELHLEAICVYVALGFFLGDDTFWKDSVCLKPSHDHKLDENGYLIRSTPNFNWHHTPRAISFDAALEEYRDLLKTIIKEQVKDNTVILPLSGGLDSRSLAAVLSELKNPVSAFSYAFENGYAEHNIAKKIAKQCHFNFQEFSIPKGYLWKNIEDLSQINRCYSEFTHPRQMAVINDLKHLDGEFLLGHWGDVLFDRGVPEGTTEDNILPLLFTKVVKKQGLVLASKLWELWGLDGDFKEYLVSRFDNELSKIDIENPSAKVRAFKTIHWAHRWTTTNLSVFNAAHTINLPYYDNRMIEFICTLPEAYLADRNLQIAHLKTFPKLAKITWEDQAPYNLYNYAKNKTPFNTPYRIVDKIRREFNTMLGKPVVLRNWELQFVGKENEVKLEHFIFDKEFNDFIPRNIVEAFYDGFKTKDSRHYAHCVSMLLTLSVWNKNKALL